MHNLIVEELDGQNVNDIVNSEQPMNVQSQPNANKATYNRKIVWARDYYTSLDD